MELTWYGLGCFRIVERGFPAVVTDPFNEEECGLVLPRTRAEVVTSSAFMDEPEKARWKGLRNVEHTFAGPGEYEVGGIFITGIATFRDAKKGAELGENIVYVFNVNGVVVCHLGALGNIPTQAQVEAMGGVHVLLLPVGIPKGMTAEMASEVVSLIEPGIVVPMEYKTPGLTLKREPVTRFLKEMGITQPTTEASLKVTAASEQEETQVILLEPQKA
jgi:L-ascorbate metabolism protein UlaG (beta-lactamase superfamily)